MYDVIIIGAGPAGLTAALYSGRAKMKTLLIESAFSGGQISTIYAMENYPGFEQPISGPDLAMKMDEQTRRFGAEIINEEVVELFLDEKVKKVKTNNNTYEGKTVIISTGAKPRELGLKNESRLIGSGISYCAVCDGAFFYDKTVAVIGGGDTAVSDALYLTRFCSKVYLVHRRDSLRATKVIQDEVFNNCKIEMVWNSTIESILGENKVEGISVKNVINDEAREISVDGIFVAVGTIPNIKLVENKLKISKSGYIITNENMATDIPGVYAAGDIREKQLRQVITAASDGAVASFMAEKYINEVFGVYGDKEAFAI